MQSKLTWFEHKDGTIEIGRRKAKKGEDRHIWVNAWDGNTMYNMKVVNIAPLYKTPWTTLTELKQVLLEHLQWRLAGICFQRIKAIAPSKNKETGWCCFTKEEETYLCGSDFSWFNPATMRMEDYNKNTFLLEKRIEFEDSDKVITIRTVVNPHKELLLEKGHWLAVNRNTNQFSKSGAELKNFVDWVRDPPLERVPKIFYGPYWPFIAFHYQCQWISPATEIQRVFAYLKKQHILKTNTKKKE